MTAQSTLALLGEVAFLRRLRRRLGHLGQGAHQASLWQVGVGDDAAVLRPAGKVVVTTDMLVEDVDFRRRWASWRDVGHKAAAVNLSDLAAMGATPVGLTAALAARSHELASDMLELLSACHKAGSAHGAPLVGGDLSETTGPLVLSVTALGFAPPRPLLRGRARVGDSIVVTGALGAAAAGLQLLEAPALCAGLPKQLVKALVNRQLRPRPRLAAAQALVASGTVRSMADVSDGLLKDVAHLLPKGLGATLDAQALPLAPGVAAVAHAIGRSPLELALSGGEDFELVWAVAPTRVRHAQLACARAHIPCTPIGVVTATSGIRCPGHEAVVGPHGQGFNHFA